MVQYDGMLEYKFKRDSAPICKSTHVHTSNIGNIINLLSYDACSIIIHALTSCRLDYCNSILYMVPRSKTDRLQILQNQCARIWTKSPRREHITPVKNTLAKDSRQNQIHHCDTYI